MRLYMFIFFFCVLLFFLCNLQSDRKAKKMAALSETFKGSTSVVSVILSSQLFIMTETIKKIMSADFNKPILIRKY